MTDLPDRRHALRFRFTQRGHRYFGTVGLDPVTGQAVEIFLQTAKAGTELEATARDAAVLCSKALQHGATISELRAALTMLEAGAPAGPVAVLLDLYVTDLVRGT